MNAAIRSKRIFFLTAVITMIALPVAWYYFSRDYTVASDRNERGDYIEFQVSDVGFGADSSFTVTARVHPEKNSPVNLGPIAGMGNRQMVAIFTNSGQWLDNTHFQARISDFQVDIRETEQGWQISKQRISKSPRP